ncbi:MAG: elongation factor G [Bdellovibrionales bacterium]
MKALIWQDGDRGESFEEEEIPEELKESAEEARSKMIETAAEFDDVLMEKYFESGELNEEEILKGLRKGTLDLKIAPVLCGSAFKNKGVQPLLDAVISFLPSPLDLPPVKGMDPEREDKVIECPTDFAAPVAALAFKIAADSFAGTMTFVRVYSGIVKAGAALLNPRIGKKERIQKILKLHANSREEVSELRAGDIGAIIGFKDTATGDTICDPKKPVALESIKFPEPVIAMAIEAKSSADQKKMQEALDRLQKEDPSCRVKVDPETGQMLIEGMGELHLEILVDRMMREYKVQANVGQPQVSYRETIQSVAKGNSSFEKEVGGKLQFGQVSLKIEPQPRGAGVAVEPKLPKGFNSEFLRAIEQGAMESCANGVVAGYQMIDLKIIVESAEVNEETSSAMAYKIAASQAFREAAQSAQAILMEPIFKLEIITPEDFLGTVIGDLNSRRGKVESMGPRGQVQVVNAEAPLMTLFGYATDLRSITQGRASFSMEFLKYESVPPKVEQEILKKIGRI